MSGRVLSINVVLLLLLPAFSALGYETLMVPTEVRFIDRSLAYDGYTLFPSQGVAYLIDMDGRIVHTWETGINPKLLDNGNILDNWWSGPSGRFGFVELDWNSTIVWQYTETRDGYMPHHDFNRIWNRELGQYTTLYIVNKHVNATDAIAAGCDPANGPYDNAWIDAVVEVDMNGTVVWEWWFFDHGIQDIAPSKKNYVGDGGNISDYPGKIDLNIPGMPVCSDWLHCNALDYNPALDQIVISSVRGEIYIIDHGNTFIPGDPNASIALAASGKGDFLYRFGDPARYGRGDPPSILEDWTTSTSGNKQIGGVHDVHWIAEGLPGAGNLLMFNNGQYMFERTPQSYAVEINPYLDADGTDTGHYVDPPAAGYHTLLPQDPVNTSKQARLVSNQTVWIYGSKSNQGLFGDVGGSAQRLPNGNTLLCSDTTGRIYEVTAEGDMAWEYVDPVSTKGVAKVIADDFTLTSTMFRAYRYGKDCPAFSGRVLEPGDPLTGPVTGADPRPAGGATETFYLDNGSAFGGYTLFSANGSTYLVDMEGGVVNTWPIGTNPRLLDNGTLLDAASTDLADLKGIEMVDWNGTVLWKYEETRPGYLMHHDFLMARNDDMNAPMLIYLASKPVTAEEALAAGCDPADGPYDGARTDGIVEVDLNGTVMWEWWFIDHGIQDIDPSKANYVGDGMTISDYPGRMNLNLPGRPVGRSWLDCNSIDYSAKLDQLVVNSELGEFYIIDHGATFVAGDPAASVALAAGPAGDFIYRFGDPARYGRGSPPSIDTDWTSSTSGDKQIGGSNDVHWIDAGLPGEGHLLVFNNGQYYFGTTARSCIFEVDPYRNATGAVEGRYVDPPAAGYNTSHLPPDPQGEPKMLSNQIVWLYFSPNSLTFFSHLGSSAQRLPNGNTLVCAMTEGHLFEVTRSGKAAWEYINPVTVNGTVERMCDNRPMTNPVFRALRYAPGSHALRGRDLSPGGTITGAPTHYLTPEDIETVGMPPSLFGTAHAPARPTSQDTVAVTTSVKRIPALASVMLTYIATNASAGGGAAGNRATVPMFDDGRHGDGLPGDWTFGASIPPFAGGTRVDYYANATTWGGLSAADPPGAPAAAFSYKVFDGAPPRTAGKLPDTGQAGDYTATFGEDSDYVINAPALSDNGDGTVTCAATGLMWQKAGGGEMTWEGALAYAASLWLGGHDDWRLPSGSELFNLLDLGRQDTALDPALFPGPSARYFWSADTLAGDPSRVWVVDAGGAIGARQKNETASAGGTLGITARCVRGNVESLQGGGFSDNGDGTATSLATGLVWQKAESPSGLAWEGALSYCEGLVLGGHDDWRLPNIKELWSLTNASLHGLQVDASVFPGARPEGYWSSTTEAKDPSRAWNVDFGLGATAPGLKTTALHVRAVRGGYNGTAPISALPEMAALPGGTFMMGDQSGLGNSSDELPLHTVTVGNFSLGRFEVTNARYCDFLNAEMARGTVAVSADGVRSKDGSVLYCDLYSPGGPSSIAWDGSRFSVTDGRMAHPATGIRWEGAAAYCNWLGAKEGYAALYDLRTGALNTTAAGYRLPTEAEWEWAALGAQNGSNPIFPWGDIADASRANWPDSSDPYEAGALPRTTPAGFYDGSLRQRADFGWPGGRSSYQTGDGSNGYGLHDLSGNALEWVNDLYNTDYYSFSPGTNPAGPANGTPMPDGKAYHALRGGSWLCGEFGYTRIADRMSGYERGPGDPERPYADVGFRVALGAAREPGGAAGPGVSAARLAATGRPADGPAADAAGNLYFTEPSSGRICVWSVDGKLSVLRNDTGGAAGLAFDSDGALVACEEGARRVARIDAALPAAAAAVLAATYDGKPFNGPDDLWIDPWGGIYFTDPPAAGGAPGRAGPSVFYLAPGAPAPVPVAAGLARPSGLAGTADGRKLYISDAGAGMTYRYTVLGNGSLSPGELFVRAGSEGLTLDESGNVYLTNGTVRVFAPDGTLLAEIAVPDRPTGLEFGGADRHTLFITTEKGLCGIRMAAAGTSNFKPRVVINEIKQETGNGTGVPAFWVELYNNGTAPADLGGMFLTNDLSSAGAWTIPANTTIAPGGFLLIWADNGRAPGPLHASFGLDAAGGVVALFMPNGLTLVDSLRFGPLPEKASWGRYPDGADRLVLMHDHPSPGAPNVQDDTSGGAGGGGDGPAGDTPGGEDPAAGTPAGGTPAEVTLDRPAGPNLVLAVIAAAVAVAAGLFVYDRRLDRKGPGS